MNNLRLTAGAPVPTNERRDSSHRLTARQAQRARICRGLVAGAIALASVSLSATGYAEVSGDATISAPVLGSTLTIKTSSQFGGAISSLKWGGKEFVNDWDHGRQFSTNASFFNRYECYNAYETGSKDDGQKPTSSAKVLSLTASGNTLTSTTQMCWYLSTRNPRLGYGDECGDPSQFLPCPPYTGPLSNYRVQKTVTIGLAGISNVITYSSVVSIPETVQKGIVQVTTVLPWEFSNLMTFDVVSKDYRGIGSYAGEDDGVKVLSTSDGAYAMGYYTPELLQRYGNGSEGGYRWGLVPPDPNYPDPDFPCAGLGGEFRFESSGPGDSSNRSYLVIGDVNQVKEGLIALHNVFARLDPDVFDWREYVAINNLQGSITTKEQAEDDWLNHGSAEGRVASSTFSAADYLALNPDVAEVFGANNYDGAIAHYISSGRSEGRNTIAMPAAGMQHAAVLENRFTRASGENAFGQLGDGSSAGQSAPVSIAAVDGAVTEIAAGDYTSFAVLNDGSLWTWGSNQYGARGDGSTGGDLATPVQVSIPVSITTPTRGGKHAVAVGIAAYAAIDNVGQVWTWGANWNGRLGDGTTLPHYSPAKVKRSLAPDDYLNGIVSIAAGGGTMAAIDAEGNVWTWGAGENGTLGNGATDDSSYPVQVITVNAQNFGAPLTGVKEVACGSSGFCIAVTRLGKVYGWGNNDVSQLGLPAGGALSVATLITVGASNYSVDEIAAGAAHCIAHSLDGNIYGWGYNGRGQLGSGSPNVAQAPPIAMNDAPGGLGPITQLAAGANFNVLARNVDRAVFVVGDNQSGQLGIPGDRSPRYTPVRSSF